MTVVGWHLPDLNAIHELFCLVCCRVPLGGRGEQLHEEPSSVAGGNAGCTAPSTCCSVTVGHSLAVCSSSRPLGNTFCARFGTQHRTLMCPHNAYIAWRTASAQSPTRILVHGARSTAQGTTRYVPQRSTPDSGHGFSVRCPAPVPAPRRRPPLRQGPLSAPLRSPPLGRAPLPAGCPWSRAARGA